MKARVKKMETESAQLRGVACVRPEQERLRAEQERLRAEQERLRAEEARTWDIIRSQQVFQSLDVPKEDIRLLIYELVLVPGKASLRHKVKLGLHDGLNTMAPPSFGETQLFEVCKQIKEEALPVYPSKNVFIWPPGGESIKRLFDSKKENSVCANSAFPSTSATST